MKFDVMTAGSMTWERSAELARALQDVGVAGMLFTETAQVPWMQIACAAQAAPQLDFSTGIAVAFPRSPMMSAQIAWELAQNTKGRFRLGLGSQVKGHIERRYAMRWDKPAPQMRDYVGAFKACIRAFRGEERLSYDGEYYSLSLLPAQWAPERHEYEDVKVDISAVGPIMLGVAGELCDGVHVHPMHSMHYVEQRLLPGIAKGAARAGRDPADVDLIVPAFTVAGNTPEEREPLLQFARTQVAFYGSTPNYAFQFDDLGFTGVSQQLNDCMRQGDMQRMNEIVTDEILDHFAVIAAWDDMADVLAERYAGRASRVVSYLAAIDVQRNPGNLPKWGAIAKALA